MAGPQTYQVEFKRSAGREFRRLSTPVQERIGDAVRLLAHSPFAPQLGVKKLRGTHDLYRMRVGDYRILYEVRSEIVTIVVIKIGHRREVYRR